MIYKKCHLFRYIHLIIKLKNINLIHLKYLELIMLTIMIVINILRVIIRRLFFKIKYAIFNIINIPLLRFLISK